jgi:hypothetical protein
MRQHQRLLVLLCELHARRYRYGPAIDPDPEVQELQEVLRGVSTPRLLRVLERWNDLRGTILSPYLD